MQDTTKQCGNCGKNVHAADITCPHCGALLAAYEAPAGSETGINAAVTPASVSTHPDPPTPPTLPMAPTSPQTPDDTSTTPGQRTYTSITGIPLSDLDADRPEVGATTTSLGHTISSPITQALKETRIAASLDKPDAEPSPDVTEAHAALVTVLDQKATRAPSLRKEPKTASYPSPSGKQHDSPSEPPRPTRTLQHANSHPQAEVSQTSPFSKTSGVSIGAFVGIVLFLIIISSAVRSGAAPGFLIIFFVIGGLFLYMRTLANKTGRKTTSIPKNKDRR